MRPWLALAAVVVGAACDAGEQADEACGGARQRVIDGGVMALADVSAPSLAGGHVVITDGLPGSALVVDACSGEVVTLHGDELSGAFALSGEDGVVAVGHRQPTGEVLLLDRLDEPGLDEPRTIAMLDPVASGWYRWSTGLLLWSGPLMRDTPGPSQILVYPGPDGPLAPAVRLADDVVWLGRGGVDVFAARTAEGELLHVHAGVATVLHAAVRSAGLAPDGAQVVWQDRAGAWTLHTLASGDEVRLGRAAVEVRSAGPDAAGWRWTDDAVAALDASGVVIAAFDRGTGQRLTAAPKHVAVRADEPGALLLLTVQAAPERIELAWDPHTGAAHEWYRGPDIGLVPQGTEDGVRYFAAPDRLYLSRPGGAPVLLQVAASLDAISLADGRTLMRVGAADESHRLVVLDGSGAHATTIAEGVTRWSVTGESPPRLTYTIASGDEAGVWVTALDRR